MTNGMYCKCFKIVIYDCKLSFSLQRTRCKVLRKKSLMRLAPGVIVT